MALNFKTSNLILTRQVVTATGNNLYVNGNEVGALISGNLIQTGVQLGNTIASTGSQAWNHGQNNALNLSGNINASGRRAWDDAINLSGNLGLTGQTIWNALLATSGNLASTGLQLTASLSVTGSTLWQRDLAISGALQALINNADADVNSINGQSGTLLIQGTGGLTVLSGAPGLILISGDQSISGALSQTGSTIWNALLTTSGNLVTTGATLIARDLATSGALDSKLTATGATIWNALLATSGNLAVTGSTLDTKINTASGYGENIYVHRTGDENISGNKTFTGQTAFVTPFLASPSASTSHSVTVPQAVIDVQGYLSATNPSGILVRRNATQYIHMHESDGSTHMIEGINGVGNPKVFRIRNNIDITGGPNVLEIANSAFGGVNLVLVTVSGNVILPVGGSYLQAPNVSGFNISGQNFWSGNQNLAAVLYPRSNPSGYVTGFDLYTTGSILYNDIIGLSGVVNTLYGTNIVYTTGTQTIASNKTFSGTTQVWGNGLIISQPNNTISDQSGVIWGLGDKGLRIDRANSSNAPSSEYLVFGGAAGGNIFSGANNVFLLDFIGPNAAQTRDFRIRFSNDTGLTRTTVATFSPGSTTLTVTGFSRSDYGFLSGAQNLGDIFYPRSNPSGYVTGLDLYQTGATLYSMLIAESGVLTNQITNTGATIWNALLTTSGNLQTTGQTLINQINGLSGVVNVLYGNNIVYTTGNQTVNGVKTFTTGIIEPNTKTDAISFLMPTGNDFTYEFAQFTFTNGAASLWTSLTAEFGGLSLSKEYNIPIYFNSTTGAWTKLNPIVSSPPYVGNDIDLEALVSSNNLVLRARRIMGTVSGNMWISIKEDGRVSTSTMTVTANTGITGAITGFYPGTVLSQVGNYTYNRGNLDISGSALVSGSPLATQTYVNSVGSTISGNLTATGATIWNALINTSGNLQTTGATLIANNLATSGQLDIRLVATGLTLTNQINSASGYAESIYVHRTGSELVTGIKTFLSELRFNSGLKTPVRFVGGSANTNFVSGDYMLISTGVLNGLTGILPSPVDYSGVLLTVINAGSTSYQISGNIGPDVNPTIAPFDAIQVYAYSGAWQYIRQTGTPLTASLNALSGYIGVTSGILRNDITANALNLSGNLTATGATIWNALLTTSGNLQTTGSTLIARDLATSGQLDIRLVATGLTLGTNLTATGATIWNALLTTSGNLQTTGSTIWGALINTSGNLQTTGQTLVNQINGLSGVVNTLYGTNIVYTTGNQTINGTKTFQGVTYIQNLIVTGTQTIVNTQEFDVATNFIILNATGGARDAGIFVSTGFTGGNSTGALIGFDIPSNTWRFGIGGQQDDLSRLPIIGSYTDITGASGLLTTNLTNTGATIWNALLNTSGNLQTTGATLIARDLATSGQLDIRLVATGLTLLNQIASVSGYGEGIYVHRTGNELISGLKTFQQMAFDPAFPVYLGSLNSPSSEKEFVLYGRLNSGSFLGTGSFINGYKNTLAINSSSFGNDGNVIVGNTNSLSITGTALDFANASQNTIMGIANILAINTGDPTNGFSTTNQWVILGRNNVTRINGVSSNTTNTVIGQDNTFTLSSGGGSHNTIYVGGHGNTLTFTSGFIDGNHYILGFNNIDAIFSGNNNNINFLLGSSNALRINSGFGNSNNTLLGINNSLLIDKTHSSIYNNIFGGLSTINLKNYSDGVTPLQVGFGVHNLIVGDNDTLSGTKYAVALGHEITSSAIFSTAVGYGINAVPSSGMAIGLADTRLHILSGLGIYKTQTGDWTNSGLAVVAQVLLVSGLLDGRIVASGRRAWDDATNLSGNLTTTGATIWNALLNTSGNLASTGANLQAQINILTTNLTNTGATVWNSLLTTSGNLQTTGQTLYNLLINESGRNEVIYLHRTGDELATGIKTWLNEARLFGGLKTPERFIGGANYSIISGDYIVVATGSTPNVTGILPNIANGGYSGVLFTVINARSIDLPISGIIGLDNNPSISPNDAFQIYGGSGVWHYIRQTGSPLTSVIVGLSGNLAITGATIWNGLLTTSGNLASTGSNLQGQINTLTNNLTTTGATIWNALLTTSGNLASTGSNLQGQINTLTINLTSTGAKIWDALILTSGNLQTTGSTLIARDAAMSGQLDVRLVATGLTLLNQVSSASGYAEGIYVHRTGEEFISGNKTVLGEFRLNGGLKTPARYIGSGNYNLISGDYIVIATGSVANITGILPNIANYSGAIFTIINNRTTTLAVSGIIGPDVNPFISPYDALQIYGGSGTWHYIRQTGSPIWNDTNNNAINLSGNLFTTGSTLIARDLATSGQLDIRLVATGLTIGTNLTATGATIWNALLNTSGNLALTGSNLQGQINTLTTNLTSTGATIWNALLTTSGNLQTTGANLSAVKITGSAIINNPNFTGAGNTTVYISGSTVYVSGGAGSAGITQAQLDSVSGWTNSIFVHRTGTEIISGDKTFSGNHYLMSGNVGVNTLAPVVLLDISGVAKADNVISAAFNGAQQAGTRNRIINGDMRIDQRNPTGAYITTVGALGYVIDRWLFFKAATGAFTGQQTPVSPPSGFGYSVKYTNGNAISTGQLVAEQALFAQRIEESNIWDLGYGTSGAQPTTLSFWVKAGATGIFGGSLRNKNIAGATFISCPYTYQINNTNTWEYKTVTIPGPTSGNWGYGTSGALNVIFSLGCGTGAKAPSFVWSSGNFVDAIGTTLYPTSTDNGNISFGGIQFERGTQATPFEYRTYGESLKDCERYCEVIGNQDGDSFTAFGAGMGNSTTQANVSLPYRTLKRAKPTITFSNASDFGVLAGAGSVIACTSISASNIGKASAMIQATTAGSLTQGDGAVLVANSTTNSQIIIDAEL